MIVVFKFSVACKWCVLIKEDKDNLLQFAKVFPNKLPIRQSYPHAIFRCMVAGEMRSTAFHLISMKLDFDNTVDAALS